MNKKELKVVLIGQTGSGKSQLGNFILQNEFFKVGNGKSSETEIISEGNTYLDGMSVTIVDTPGLNDTGSKDEEIMNKIVKKFKDDNSIDGIILVYSFRNMRRVQKHQELVNNLIEIFGKDLLEKRLKVILLDLEKKFAVVRKLKFLLTFSFSSFGIVSLGFVSFLKSLSNIPQN